jgi:hypothetical protein
MWVSVWVGLVEWQVLIEARDALNCEGWTKNKRGWDALEEHNDPSSCAGVIAGEHGDIIKILHGVYVRPDQRIDVGPNGR